MTDATRHAMREGGFVRSPERLAERIANREYVRACEILESEIAAGETLVAYGRRVRAARKGK